MGQDLKHGLVGLYVKIQINMPTLWLLPILKWACGWWRTEGWMILLWSLRGIMSLIIHRGWISGSCAIPCVRALRKKQLLEEHSVVLVCVNTHLTVIFLPSWSASHASISRWMAVSLMAGWLCLLLSTHCQHFSSKPSIVMDCYSCLLGSKSHFFLFIIWILFFHSNLHVHKQNCFL